MKTFLPPLSHSEEADCIKRLGENDIDARNELILHNMRLVAHVAKKYVGSEEDQEELISIGTVGLIKAVSSFNTDYGSKFSTYAIRCIENEILMYFRSKYTQKEIAQKMGISRSYVSRIEKKALEKLKEFL